MRSTIDLAAVALALIGIVILSSALSNLEKIIGGIFVLAGIIKWFAKK